MAFAANDFRKSYGPWALISGASDGIGAAMAKDVGAAGLNVVLVARREDRLASLANEIRGNHGVDAQVVAADLGTQEGITDVLQQIDGKEIGLLAACAGFGSVGPFVDQDIAHELNMIDVNCNATLALAHPIAREMCARKKGGIILMSSIVAFQGVPNSANYAATKAYVQTLAEGLAVELAPHGVDVLASAPGPVHTGFASRAGMQMGGAATPETVARATLKALGRVRTTRPGGRAKLLGYGLGSLPSRMRSRILGGIMKGMMNNGDGA